MERRQMESLTRALAESQAERDRLAAKVAQLQENATQAQQLAALDAWEPLAEDGLDVTLVGGEGCYEYPLEALFVDEFRARQYCEWLRTTATPECEGEDAECYTVEMYRAPGRLAPGCAAFWNNGVDNRVLSKRRIGTCGSCGGPVTVPTVFFSVDPPTPSCGHCGRIPKAAHGPVLDMTPRKCIKGIWGAI